MNTYLDVAFFFLLASELAYGTVRMYHKREYLTQASAALILFISYFVLLVGRSYFHNYFEQLSKWADGSIWISIFYFIIVGDTLKSKERKYGPKFMKQWTLDIWHSSAPLWSSGISMILFGIGMYTFHDQAIAFGSPRMWGLVFIEVMLYATGGLIFLAAILRYRNRRK